MPLCCAVSVSFQDVAGTTFNILHAMMRFRVVHCFAVLISFPVALMSVHCGGDAAIFGGMICYHSSFCVVYVDLFRAVPDTRRTFRVIARVRP